MTKVTEKPQPMGRSFFFVMYILASCLLFPDFSLTCSTLAFPPSQPSLSLASLHQYSRIAETSR